MMKATVLAIIIGMAICATTFASGVATKIPKGITKYKLKTTTDMDKLYRQIKEIGLLKSEFDKANKQLKAIEKPGAIALTVNNKDPVFTVNFAGTAGTFKDGVMASYKFLNREGMRVCHIYETILMCRNTLDNGFVSQLELIFKDKEVTLIRLTDGIRVVLQLVRV